MVGRSFLHQQGATVCRGFVEKLTVGDDSWELIIRDIEYLDRTDHSWTLKLNRGDYGGSLDYSTFYLHADGRIEISGYGMVIHVAPKLSEPWTEYHWPELDNYPGGPMRT